MKKKKSSTASFLLPVHGDADQRVADESDHEDDGVHEYENPFGLLRRDVFHQEVLVFLVRQVGHLVVFGEVTRRRVADRGFPLNRCGVHHHVPVSDVRHEERDDHGQSPFQRHGL